MGKYSHVLSSLRKLEQEPTYQQKIDAVKQKIGRQSAGELAHMYRGVRQQKDELEEQISELNIEVEALCQLMQDEFETQGITSVKLESGGSVSIQPEPYMQVKDKDVFRNWVVAQGLENLMSLPWQTANSLAKERLVNGEPHAPGTEMFVKMKVVLRKS